ARGGARLRPSRSAAWTPRASSASAPRPALAVDFPRDRPGPEEAPGLPPERPGNLPTARPRLRRGPEKKSALPQGIFSLEICSSVRPWLAADPAKEPRPRDHDRAGGAFFWPPPKAGASHLRRGSRSSLDAGPNGKDRRPFPEEVKTARGAPSHHG